MASGPDASSEVACLPSLVTPHTGPMLLPTILLAAGQCSALLSPEPGPQLGAGWDCRLDDIRWLRHHRNSLGEGCTCVAPPLSCRVEISGSEWGACNPSMTCWLWSSGKWSVPGDRADRSQASVLVKAGSEEQTVSCSDVCECCPPCSGRPLGPHLTFTVGLTFFHPAPRCHGAGTGNQRRTVRRG